ncbi:MAG: hypothetical protein ACK4GD_11130 [Sphingomonadaceae bacterium]
MSDAPPTPAEEMPVEAVLREELARGDIVLGTIGPILGHLLAQADHSLFNDEVVARIRGMTRHVARQLLAAGQDAAGESEQVDPAAEARLAGVLAGNVHFLIHCHALALEAQLARQIEQRSGIDPVLSPLMQALIASDDAATASTAMAALAAQARFMQYQRRMELPLAELPGDLFHQAMTAWRADPVAGGAEQTAAAEQKLRAAYDEGGSRLGLLSRLVSGLGNGVTAALSVSHAGSALFLSGLAVAARQERDLTAIATNDSQLARLALALRAAGLKPKEVEEQFLYLHPDVALPEGFEFMRADRAAGLLSASGRRVAG